MPADPLSQFSLPGLPFQEQENGNKASTTQESTLPFPDPPAAPGESQAKSELQTLTEQPVETADQANPVDNGGFTLLWLLPIFLMLIPWSVWNRRRTRKQRFPRTTSPRNRFDRQPEKYREKVSPDFSESEAVASTNGAEKRSRNGFGRLRFGGEKPGVARTTLAVTGIDDDSFEFESGAFSFSSEFEDGELDDTDNRSTSRPERVVPSNGTPAFRDPVVDEVASRQNSEAGQVAVLEINNSTANGNGSVAICEPAPAETDEDFSTSLRQQNKILVRESEKLRDELSETKHQLAMLMENDKLPELEQELESVRARISKMQGEGDLVHSSAAAKTEKQWQEELGHLQSELELQRANNDSTAHELATVRQQLATLQSASDCEIGPAAHSELAGKLKDKTVKLEQVRKKLREKLESIRDLHSELEIAHSELAGLQESSPNTNSPDKDPSDKAPKTSSRKGRKTKSGGGKNRSGK